jgi:hypothetical protein
MVHAAAVEAFWASQAAATDFEVFCTFHKPSVKACIIPGLDRPSSQLYLESRAAGHNMLMVAGTVLTITLTEQLC